MRDGIIKGTGNSWFLRTVANAKALYPTWDAALDALIQGTFPIDLNGMNPTGWSAVGTPLSKANLLSDQTGTALALSGDPTVDQALARLRTLAQTAQDTAEERLREYTGDGAASRVIDLGVYPYAVLVMERGFKIEGSATNVVSVPTGGLAVRGAPVVSKEQIAVEIVSSGFKVAYFGGWGEESSVFTNSVNSTYTYIALY